MSEQAPSPAEENNLTAEQVAEYLENNPEFFVENEALLKVLRIPHRSGTAISLVERQLQVFREQRDALQHELANLIDIARENDRFFDKSKRLLMNLLEAQSLDELVIVLEDSVRNDFSVPHFSLLLFGEADAFPISNVRLTPYESVAGLLGTLAESSKAVCGQFSPEQLKLLFPHADEQVGSAAVIPLKHMDKLGLLALGSEDPLYFDSGMGSLFLSYISDSLSRMLPPLMAQERGAVNPESIAKLME